MRNAALRHLGLVFWHLLPANPILVRVVHGSSRRVRHLWIRAAYLGFLLLVVVFAMLTSGGQNVATLADLAKQASAMFKNASITQLALMCFLAPVFAAGAITQERDAQTFHILMSTPLSNAQIVLGSLMSRLYFVLVLLLAGLPIFLLTMIYGGVTLAQVLLSFAIAGATAVLTGSLAISISMVRVGTRRTIFSFYLMIGLYLLAVYAAASHPSTWAAEAPPNAHGQRLSWLAAFHPFLSLDVALNRVPAPDVAVLGERTAAMRYLLAFPHRCYLMLTLGASVLLVLVAMIYVRRPKDEEQVFLGSLWSRWRGAGTGERRRKPRQVWANPVAWREATTRASALTRGLSHYGLIGGGVATAVGLLWWYADSGDVAATQKILSVVVMVELALVLLAATNTAATAISKERESNTLELLQTTPLTSRDIVWGKLRGLVIFALPLLAIPAGTVLLFGVWGLWRGAQPPIVAIEAGLEAMGLMVAYSAAACMLGLHTSLHSKRTVQAVMVAVGVLVVGCLVLTLVVDEIVLSAEYLGAAIAPLTPFTGVRTLVNPSRLLSAPGQWTKDWATLRVFAAVGTVVAIGIYALIVAGAYKSMVRNFDLVIRRQTAG